VEPGGAEIRAPNEPARSREPGSPRASAARNVSPAVSARRSLASGSRRSRAPGPRGFKLRTDRILARELPSAYVRESLDLLFFALLFSLQARRLVCAGGSQVGGRHPGRFRIPDVSGGASRVRGRAQAARASPLTNLHPQSPGRGTIPAASARPAGARISSASTSLALEPAGYTPYSCTIHTRPNAANPRGRVGALSSSLTRRTSRLACASLSRRSTFSQTFKKDKSENSIQNVMEATVPAR
jgi:hypothetical protein